MKGIVISPPFFLLAWFSIGSIFSKPLPLFKNMASKFCIYSLKLRFGGSKLVITTILCQEFTPPCGVIYGHE